MRSRDCLACLGNPLEQRLEVLFRDSELALGCRWPVPCRPDVAAEMDRAECLLLDAASELVALALGSR